MSDTAKLEKEVRRLEAALAAERAECVRALIERDYNGKKWRFFEIECNRLGSTISHNPLT